MMFRWQNLVPAAAAALLSATVSCTQENSLGANPAGSPPASANQHTYQVKGVIKELKPDGKTVAAAVSAAKVEESRRDARHHRQIEPALSPTITRKLSRVIPANLQIDARWDTIRKTREAAKKHERDVQYFKRHG